MQENNNVSKYMYMFTIIRSVELGYIAITTLQIRRLLLDDVESANACIVRCSIYSCAPGNSYERLTVMRALNLPAASA